MTTPKAPRKPEPPVPVGLIVPKRVPLTERIQAVEAAARKHLEPAELKRLWGALEGDPFWRGYFGLQFHFGCRCSEIALVLKEDVSLADGRVLIKRLKKTQKAGPRGYSEHAYTIPPKLVARLEAVQPHVPANNPFFFGSRYGVQATRTTRASRMAAMRISGGFRAMSRSAAHLRFVTAAADAGLPVNLRHTHVLRHSRATLLFAKGATEAEVQHILGHSDPKTTRLYIGWAANLKRRADEIAVLLGDE